MGHVPSGALRVLRPGRHLQGRQRRRAPREGALAIRPGGATDRTVPVARVEARRSLGAVGERLAAAWYEEHGYEIVERNWRCRDGEIDLVARRGRTLVFCEVKTRSGTAFGSPAEAVTRTKQARIRRLAARWLEGAGRGRSGVVRFDVASVLRGRVEILEAAF